jgi:hypothetical protein
VTILLGKRAPGASCSNQHEYDHMIAHKTPFADCTQSQKRGKEDDRERERRFAESNLKEARNPVSYPYSRVFQMAYRHLFCCSVYPAFAACLVQDCAEECDHAIVELGLPERTVCAGRITSLHISQVMDYGRKGPRSTNTWWPFS